MDSVSQAVLGSSLTLAVIGDKLGPRRSVIFGAVLGTLPDLDVLVPLHDAVDRFVLHRSVTHSLIMHLMITPILVEPLRLWFIKSVSAWRLYLVVFLVLSTHALLDALTIYGTQLFWPVSRHPYGTGSIFIIDPLYTLPLLAASVLALMRRTFSATLRRATLGALAVSTAYLGWSLMAQNVAHARALRQFDQAGIRVRMALATPTPFNTLYWRVIGIDGERYFNIYLPLLDSDDGGMIYEHRRLAIDTDCLTGNDAARKLEAFSKGYFMTDVEGDDVHLADLRMGLPTGYVFDFDIGRIADGEVLEIEPQRIRHRFSAEGDLGWLLAGITGDDRIRPAESDALIGLSPIVPRDTSRTTDCPSD
ncbi:MAG: metal-dependent hydrolase [Geminicoccaceae bacterium]|nr:metal-dependent hydrolase [Geminicoccaceae bacterium]